VQRLSEDVATVRDATIAADTLAADIKREQDKYEADIAQVRQRMVRDEQRMTAGAVSSAKELESLQHEVDSLHRRQTDLEDGELEVMERLESVENELAALTARSASLEGEAGEVARRRDEALAQIAADETATQADREQLAPSLPADLLALYDKLRAQLGGVGAAALRQKRCDGCRLELNAIDLGKVRSAADDEVLRCEECRRILVRTTESGL